MRFWWDVRTAVLTLVCVVGLFLFPAHAGSFSSTHGPVTAFRSVHEARKVKVAIATTRARLMPAEADVSFEFESPCLTSAALSEGAVAPPIELSSSLRI